MGPRCRPARRRPGPAVPVAARGVPGCRPCCLAQQGHRPPFRTPARSRAHTNARLRRVLGLRSATQPRRGRPDRAGEAILTAPHDAAPPLDPNLAALALAAAEDVLRATEEVIGRGGWIPRVALPTVGAFDSGWPNLTKSLSAQPDNPPDRAAMFAEQQDRFHPLAYADVPALAAFIDHVERRDDLRERLIAPHPGGGPPMADFLRSEAARLPVSIIDRAAALGDIGLDHLLELYRQRENDWLLPSLPVDYVIPLALTAMDLDEPLDLDANIRLEPIDEKTHAARTPSAYGSWGVPDPVLDAATHALVLAGHRIDNPGPIPRLFSRADSPLPLDDADLVCQALRVLTHLPVGYAQVLRRPVGWASRWTHDLPPLNQVAAVRRYPDSFDDYGWLRSGPKISRESLDRLPDVLVGLRKTDSTMTARIRLAARRLSTAELRADPDDRTVDACIGVEALLGEGRDELTHRLCLRAAAALSNRPDGPADATAVYRLLKSVYGARSAIVHGNTSDKHRTIKAPDGTPWATDVVACMILRDLLHDQLTRTDGWTPESLDALLLTRLSAPPGADH